MSSRMTFWPSSPRPGGSREDLELGRFSLCGRRVIIRASLINWRNCVRLAGSATNHGDGVIRKDRYGLRQPEETSPPISPSTNHIQTRTLTVPTGNGPSSVLDNPPALSHLDSLDPSQGRYSPSAYGLLVAPNSSSFCQPQHRALNPPVNLGVMVC
jgi:hypothetical protein